MRMVVLVGVFVAVATGLAAAGPLDKPAFTATPAELLAAARAATPAGHAVAVLRDDVSFTFDERGRVEKRYRTVFTVVAPSGADDWGTIGLDWQPFYQDKPTIRARVVNADGSVTDFDPALMHDAPAVNESPTVFSDRRDLTAPLPRLAVGAVVEEEFVFTDREPLLAAGTVHWIGPLRSMPVPRKVITISSPATRKATVVTRGPASAWKPTLRTVAGRAVVTYDLSNLPPYEDGQPGTPVDWLPNPVIGISTGASWAAVAADYRAQIEAKLAAPLTVPPDLLAATPRATVDRILAWLHGRVRYTGIELSESAIVPFAPADTLARGFGDCKDKATLLVALLRAAKIPADVALLSTGPGADVDVALPGMGEFDHAIVRAVVDGKDLWIDATEDLLPAGQLPVRDQGRRALIIGAGTKALTTTPASRPADNLIREVRTFHLVEDGAPRVTEVSEQRGFWSDDLRGFVRNNSKDEVAKSLTKYVEAEYRARYVSFTATDPHDLQTPFALTIEAEASTRAGSDRDHQWAWIFPNDALDKLPGSFSDTDADTDAAVKARKVGYVWSYPHTYEIVNRFELPPGYSAPDLPAAETRALGTMTLTTTRTRAPGVYTVTFRLDTGKLRITADELRASRAAVRALRDEEGQQVLIPLDAAQLAQQGKAREALAEYRRLIALHPKEAIHHGQLASLYLNLGMGAAARREAKLATTLEPRNGDAYVVQAYILARDLLGRPGLPGSDRAAAIAALRKAIALSPTHVGAKSDLAMVLSRAGRRLSADPADHRAALALLREVSEAGEGAYDQRLISAALFAGDAAALQAFAKSRPDSPERRRALVAAAALTSGEEAVRVATSLASGADRDTLLAGLSDELLMLRQYDVLEAVVRARPTMTAKRRAVFANLKAIDLSKLDPAAPTTPAIRAWQRITIGAVANPPWSADTESELAASASDSLNTGTFALWPEAAVVDLLMSSTTVTATGDAKHGWRVVIDSAGNQLAMFVVKRGGRAFMVGGPVLTTGVGTEMHAALGRGDLAGARAWLVRLADDPTRLTSTTFGAFLARHRAEFDDAPRPLLELAASLAMGPRLPARSLPIVRTCAGLTGVDDRIVCASTLGDYAMANHDWREAVAAGQALLAATPDDAGATGWLGRALAADGKLADAAALLDAAIAKRPDDERLREIRVEVALADSWAQAMPLLDALVAPSTAGIQALNNAAWARLFYDPTPGAARVLIERAMARGNDPPANVRNTYAAVLAEDGEPRLAWQQVEAGLGVAPLTDADRYVLGRIAEQYDLRDDAIAMYRAIAPVPWNAGLPSSWDFAQKRLKAMGVTP